MARTTIRRPQRQKTRGYTKPALERRDYNVRSRDSRCHDKTDPELRQLIADRQRAVAFSVYDAELNDEFYETSEYLPGINHLRGESSYFTDLFDEIFGDEDLALAEFLLGGCGDPDCDAHDDEDEETIRCSYCGEEYPESQERGHERLCYWGAFDTPEPLDDDWGYAPPDFKSL